MISTDMVKAAREGDEQALTQMITDNAGLIWSVARRYFGQGVEAEDLYQLGCLGFLKAVRGFDESFGTQFSTYAVPKIAGEIRRFLRDDGPVKVSRGVKERARRIRLARDKLSFELGREPRLSELSRECGMTAEEIAGAEIASAPVESLQFVSGEDGFTLENVLGSEGMEERVVESVALRQAIAELPERERAVLALRYDRGFTQDQCAKVMGVSQVQVSRLERRAVQCLRNRLHVNENG